MLFVKPIKGKKAKTVSCQDAVVHTAKKAEAEIYIQNNVYLLI